MFTKEFKVMVFWAAVLIIAPLAAFYISKSIRARTSPYTAELRDLQLTKLAFLQLGAVVSRAMKAHPTVETFRELCSVIEKDDSDLKCLPEEPNPFPTILPPGTYGRLERFGSSTNWRNRPFVWKEIEIYGGSFVYITLGGEIVVVHRREWLSLRPSAIRNQ